ncbi:MAG: T9SS type A sorting domain-containing protein [Gammaproteobacteria bacterium]|nr:T9SS type A sorting domain-containing protein [Gammaproteobacteria bacterium]
MKQLLTHRAGLLIAGLVVMPLGTPGEARGQEDVTVIDAGGAGNDLVVPTRPNLFQLRAFGDEGAAGVRTNGSNSWCLQNIQGFSSRFNFGCRTGWYVRQANGQFNAAIFDMGMKWGAPASDLPEVIDPATSGLGGGGFTVNMTTLIIGGAVQGGGDKLWASDRSPVDLLNLAAKTTEDATCTNHTALRDGFMFSGFQLTPTSDCEGTHPASGWQGSHPIPAESYLELQASAPEFGAMYDLMNPNDYDPFAFWRVPEEMQATEKFLGDWQTYGELSDWYRNALERYGTVVPGGAGSPNYAGWPLGLTQFYDGFYFGLPTVGNVMYFQSIIVNESEKVYGVGMTYDSVYIGMNVDPLLQGQGDAHYFDPVRSAMLWKETGSRCADAIDPPGSGCNRTGDDDWNNGAAGAGIVFLKTPIGDARYKLFSDPSSDFYNPAHPRAGDTIMFQHQRQCGFGGCIPRTWSRSQRAHFGHFASIGEYTLDGETPGDLSDGAYHRIFRPEAWPERTGVYNKYVPGEGEAGAPTWDWNHDGQSDTIYADACGSRGCVALWADTLPSGYTNSYGNISDIAVGPVHMAPGDTVPFVVALVGAADSTSMESALDNAIGFYQQMYLGPETAPPPVISAVDVVGGQASSTGEIDGNEISLFFDDTPEEWVDPYLANLDVSADIARNFWLADSVAARSANNVAAIHIFKSCDGGSTWTQDGDCDGDPVFDETSKWNNFGWQPYTTFEAEDDGTLPNVFEDQSLIPGVTYTYSIVTETRGAKFNVVRGTHVDSLLAEEVVFAPELIGAVSASGTNPNVAVVYAPLNLAAGASRAELNEVSRSGNSTVPVEFSVVGTSPVSGQYRVVFGDKLVVNQVDNLDDTGSPTSTQTTVAAQSVRTITGMEGEPVEVVIASVDFNRSGNVTISGLEELPVDSAMQSSMQRTTVFEGGFGMVVAAGATPLLASTTLEGDEATPGAFFSREDFPFFTVSVDAGAGGTLDPPSRVFTTASADTVADRVQPTVWWLTSSSGYVGGDEYGEYAIVWNADAWGAGAPFRLPDPAIEATVAASLSGRPAASTSSTGEDVLAAVQEVDPDIETLESYALPFSVRNNTYGRDVQIAVVDHQESVLVGQGVDTARVEVPAGVWVPGDQIYFVETVTRELTDDQGSTVLDAGGQPATETATVVTFDVTLGCDAPRPSCDPTTGGSTESGYIPVTEQVTLTVPWLVPLQSGDEVVVDVQRAITAAEAAATGAVSLDDVHVVPNPYLHASAFERATDARVLKFTNLPQEGTIRIFDVAGRFIQEIVYGPEDLQGIDAYCGAGDCGGDLNWDMQTRERTNLGAGLYIFVLESGGQKKMGKFVVIR